MSAGFKNTTNEAGETAVTYVSIAKYSVFNFIFFDDTIQTAES